MGFRAYLPLRGRRGVVLDQLLELLRRWQLTPPRLHLACGHRVRVRLRLRVRVRVRARVGVMGYGLGLGSGSGLWVRVRVSAPMVMLRSFSISNP